MDLPSALPQQVVDALARGATVLTANQRAARTLRRAFDLRQRALGHACWEPPAILAWDAWMQSLWHSLLLEGHISDLLLNATQEQALWRAIIAADAALASLHPVDALAQTAADAWELLHQYGSRFRLLTYPGNSDTHAFSRWVAEFDRRCSRAHYVSRAQLPETLRVAVAAGHLTFPSGLLLVGFDSKTPAQIALLDAIRATFAPIDELGPSQPAPSLTLAAAPDGQAELTACAIWLRNRLTHQPASRIAVIVPLIDTRRAEIDRVFRHVLAPELDDIASSITALPYEFSLGIPLALTPLVATALDILRWATGPLPLDRVSALLLSPHFAAAQSSDAELLARAEFDAFALRQQSLLQPEISLADLRRFASSNTFAPTLPVLLQHLRILSGRKNFGKAVRSHAEWAATIHEILDDAGWAVPSRLDSIEFQTRRKWDSALDELTTLDFEGARASFAEALAALERISADTLFAPESRHAAVQIMGPLESAGSTFDAVWFLEANDLAWPSMTSTNPLLPWPLQRDFAMPGASVARDSAHARRITERIAGCAPIVLFSYAQESAEGHQRPSPSLACLTLDPRSSSAIAPPPLAAIPIQLDSLADDAPIPPPPDSVLQGGAAILQAQAACGFRAFAEKRLFASALDSASLGLDPVERGSLIHAVLEHFWVEIKTQAALKQMPPAQRDAQLNRSIEVAFARYHSHPASGWPRAYLDTERQRLLNLLTRWLDYEATQRPAFAVTAREEKLHDVQVGPLRLDIRVDRIDTVLRDPEEGETGEIILDYKTGPTSPSGWLDGRPDEPQLPLYAVVANSPHLAAIAFATIRPGKEMGLCGFQSEKGILPKSSRLQTESLDTHVQEWREVLTSLAEDFHSGTAIVSPKRYPHTCTHCAQRLLCRLDLSALEADALDDSEPASYAEVILG